jgi:hypothetical protein
VGSGTEDLADSVTDESSWKEERVAHINAAGDCYMPSASVEVISDTLARLTVS